MQNELIRRAIKYLVEGLVIAVVCTVLPKKSLNMEEVVMIALIAAATFALLDLMAPSIAMSARSGAGFAIGTGVAGGVHLAS